MECFTRRGLLAGATAATLAHGRVHSQVLMGGSGTPGYSNDAQQFFNRLITPPSASLSTQIDKFLSTLRANGILQVLDFLRLYAAPDAAMSLTNLVGPSFTASMLLSGGVPTFTPNKGWTGGSITDAINGNFNPATAGGNFVRDSAMVGGWSLTSVQQNFNLFTMINGTADTRILPAFANSATYDINDNASSSSVASTDASGLWLVNRTASNARALYRNGVQLSSTSVESTAPISQSLVFAPGPIQIAGDFGGASLTDAQILAFYNAWQALLQSPPIGAI